VTQETNGKRAAFGDQHLVAVYVKFLESAGARAAPVLYPLREVVVTSVLDKDPPCVGVGGVMQHTTCLISQMDKIYWP